MPLMIQILSPFTGTRVIPAAGVLLPPGPDILPPRRGILPQPRATPWFHASMISEPCKGGLIRVALSSTLGAGDPMDVETGESLRGVALRTALGVRSPFQGFRIGAGPTQGVALGCGRMPLWDGRPGRIAPILKGIALKG